MSNHLHIVLTDTLGELSNFMCQFLGPLAKALNALDETRGQVFERRYSAIEIVDDEALLDRIAYTVTNPAAANLVRTVEAWDGLCMWQGGNQRMECSRVRKREYRRSVATAESPSDVDIKDFTERYDVAITPVDGDVREFVEARLEMLAKKHSGKRPLGMRAVLAEDTFAAPSHPEPLNLTVWSARYIPASLSQAFFLPLSHPLR